MTQRRHATSRPKIENVCDLNQTFFIAILGASFFNFWVILQLDLLEGILSFDTPTAEFFYIHSGSSCSHFKGKNSWTPPLGPPSKILAPLKKYLSWSTLKAYRGSDCHVLSQGVKFRIFMPCRMISADILENIS